MNGTALEIRGLDAFYGDTQVLFDVSIDVGAGGITALLGANGAGKTTTLRAVSGAVRRNGAVVFQGRDTKSLKPDAIAKLGIAHVPSNRGTFLEFSVEENLQLGAYTQKDRRSVRKDMERMYALFPRLAARRRQQAGMLSGGEQQMLAIGRALMLRPALMILDEPSFGLAPLIVKEVYEMLARLNKEEQLSILVVEQNAHIALKLADHAYLLETGRVVASGSSSAMRDNEILKRSYLGA
jgi:branched-chain amino acid transport system ATP-binding protein